MPLDPQPFGTVQSQSFNISVRNTSGLVAAKTGTTDTAVTSWATGSLVTVGADSIEAVQAAATGTVVRIRAAGRYRLQFQAIKLGDGDTTVTFGVSRDVAAGGLAAAPAYATSGMLLVLPVILAAATAATIPVYYSTEINVTAAEARQVVGGVTGVQVRFHAFGAAGAPAAGLPATPAMYMVEWVGKAIPN